MHFGVGAIALIKVVSNNQTQPEIIISLTIVYVVFAILFAYVFLVNPTKTEK
jgi:ATP/ADP translocase